MSLQYSSEKIKALSIELKYIKKLIRYQNTLSNTPENFKPALLGKIDYLQTKVGITDHKKLKLRQKKLEHKLEKLSRVQQKTTYLQHISGWYLRPLINLFDSAQKMQTLTSTTEGIPALEQKPKLFVPQKYYKSTDKLTQHSLGQFFRFKAYGKGSERSTDLENQFYNLFLFTSKNPLPQTNIGELNLPSIHYNTSLFEGQLKNGIPSTLVTGLCPLSTIIDELGFKLKNGEIIRPELGFEEFTEIFESFETLIWPDKPILTDYIKIRTILELFKEHQEYPDLSVIIWYPYHEYLLDLMENVFGYYLDKGIIDVDQLLNGLNELLNRYQKLFGLVRSELGLSGSEFDENIKLIIVDKNKFEDLERYRYRLDLSFFHYIYGSFVGNELRRQLYEQLVFKHIYPTLEGKNVLHLDTSYELWVDILGGILVENNKSELSGNYSWINYPSLPSISLSHMREFNAPFGDKLYLAEDPKLFKMRVDKLPDKYLLHIASIVLGKKSVVDKDEKTLINMMKKKLLELNNLLICE